MKTIMIGRCFLGFVPEKKRKQEEEEEDAFLVVKLYPLWLFLFI